MNKKRAIRRPPPFLIGTMLVCALISVLWADGPGLTNALLIRSYIFLGYTTPKRIVDIYFLTALPLVRAGFGATIGASLWTIFRCILWRPKSIRARQLNLRGGTVAAWVIALVAFAVLFPCWIDFSSMRPTDEIYAEVFPAKQSSLNELVRLLKAHPNLAQLDLIPQNVGEDSKHVDIALERKYRQLLEVAAITRVNVSSDGNIRFQDWQYCGLTRGSVESGYCYSETPPANILTGLDGLSRAYTSPYSAARHIRGNWYIYYQNGQGG